MLWFWDFLISPGFGGLSAVMAAIIAAIVASRRDRHHKEAAARQAWWGTLTWIYDRTVVGSGDRRPLSPAVVVGVLQALDTQITEASRRGGTWAAEAHAVAALVEEYRGLPELQAYSAPLDALGEDLASRGFPSVHLGRSFREMALDEIVCVLEEAADKTIRCERAKDGGSLDVSQGSSRVRVRAVYSESEFPSGLNDTLAIAPQVIERVPSPVIVITNRLIPRYLEDLLASTNLAYIDWGDDNKFAKLQAAFLRFGIVPLASQP